MTKKDNDPFGFNKAINWDKLEDPKVLKELEKIFDDEELIEDLKFLIENPLILRKFDEENKT